MVDGVGGLNRLKGVAGNIHFVHALGENNPKWFQDKLVGVTMTGQILAIDYLYGFYLFFFMHIFPFFFNIW